MTRRSRQAIFSAVCGGALALVGLEAAIGLYLFGVPADGLAMRRVYTRVENVGDPRLLAERFAAGRPITLRDDDTAFLAAWIRPALAAGSDDVTRMIALRERIHHVAPIGEEHSAPANPVSALREAISRGARPSEALCGTFARWLVAAARTGGFEARLLHIRPKAAGPGSPWRDPNTGHYTTEIFLPSERVWILMDAFYNAHFRLNGRLVGAWDLHEALGKASSAGQVEVVQGRTQIPGMDARLLLPYFAHLAVIGDAAFLSGPEMLLRGERLRIVNWVDPGDPPFRPWDSLALQVFLYLGVGLTVGLVLLACVSWSITGRGRRG